MKNMRVVIDDLEGYIWLVQRFSERNTLSSNYSARNREYILDNLGLALDIRSIA